MTVPLERLTEAETDNARLRCLLDTLWHGEGLAEGSEVATNETHKKVRQALDLGSHPWLCPHERDHEPCPHAKASSAAPDRFVAIAAQSGRLYGLDARGGTWSLHSNGWHRLLDTRHESAPAPSVYAIVPTLGGAAPCMHRADHVRLVVIDDYDAQGELVLLPVENVERFTMQGALHWCQMCGAVQMQTATKPETWTDWRRPLATTPPECP